MVMVMVAAIRFMVLAMKNDDDNDDVEHDVKDDLKGDSPRRLEQHNIISSTTAHDPSRCNCRHEWWWRRSA